MNLSPVRHLWYTLLIAIVGSVVFGTSPLFAQQLAANNSTATPSAIRDVLTRPVTVQLTNVSLKRALAMIAASADVLIQYRSEVSEVDRSITLHVDKAPLGVVLDRVLRGTELQAVPFAADAVTIIQARALAPMPQGTIVGTVVNAKTKRPVSGATIFLDNATRGVLTGEDGSFRIVAPAGDHTILVRAVGYLKQSRQVTVTDEQTATLSFVIEPTASVLDEVVVTGTVVATARKAVPNPITVITADEIEKRGITKIEQLLRGEVPGVVAAERGTFAYRDDLGGMVTSNVYARGASTLSGGTTPLKTYVDGVELLDPTYLGTIDPKSIERIEIITGPQAATVYGSGAMGGVMQIFTKKGSGRNTPDITLSLKYGTLESNLSSGKAPTHIDALNLTGGTGPEFSYAGSLTYNYAGAWQPYMFSRMAGASVGVTHARGPVTATGSVSATTGANGTYSQSHTPVEDARELTGEWYPGQSGGIHYRQIVNQSSSQTISLNADYRATSFWQHHLTVGRSANQFDLVPSQPVYARPSDTLFVRRGLTGDRTTFGYNMTIQPSSLGIVSSTWTLGVTGSRGTQTRVDGCTVTATATSFVGCYTGGAPAVSQPLSDESWGGFGRWQLGLFDQLYLTLGLRAERNPSYGRARPIDWTPSNGITYTVEYGNVTVKLLGSYGRATRPPATSYRMQYVTTYSGYEPSQFVSQFANPDLTPEYARGPQGGMELYYGNVGSLTLNHYRQTVTDLIQSIKMDSVFLYYPSEPTYSYWVGQYQYQNTAKVRQQGWEATSSLNVGPLALKGTYSWTDSRVLSVNPQYTGSYRPGQTFTAVPSHTGSVTASYAYRGTTLAFTTNYMGKMVGYNFSSMYAELLGYGIGATRLPMYVARRRTVYEMEQPSYTKTDLAASQRMTPWASLTLTVINVGNSNRTDYDYFAPALGRQASAGVTLRFP